MSYIIVDVEADGPIPGKYSMVSFGAVLVDEALDKTFYGKVKPVSELWIPEALAISGHTREDHMTFNEPEEVMRDFTRWVEENTTGRPVFMSDNLAFDWQWINYYLHYYTGENPFGWSGRRLGDIYAGMKMDVFVRWKHLRKTKHTHHPVDDARGNAEVLLHMKELGLKIKLK
jgi:DNA polymerase III epsilon subunit-like protein